MAGVLRGEVGHVLQLAMVVLAKFVKFGLAVVGARYC